MKRFIVFPTVSIFSSLALLPMSYAASLFPFWYLGVFLGNLPSSYLLRLTISFSARYWLIYFAFGFLIGTIAVIIDMYRNKGDKSAIRRLVPNILCCLAYASILNGFNAVFSLLAFRQSLFRINGFDDVLGPLFGTIVLVNFAALIWAAIRSVTTDDVLTPRVLRDKLRERARLG